MNTKLVRVKMRNGMSKELSQRFCVTREFVSKCMCGKSNTELTFEIRQAAVELGGDAIMGYVSEQELKSKLRITGKLAKQFGVSTQIIRNAKRNIYNIIIR